MTKKVLKPSRAKVQRLLHTCVPDFASPAVAPSAAMYDPGAAAAAVGSAGPA